MEVCASGPQNPQRTVMDHAGGRKERTEIWVLSSLAVFFLPSYHWGNNLLNLIGRIGETRWIWGNRKVSNFQTNSDIPFAQLVFIEELLQGGHSAEYVFTQKLANNGDSDCALATRKILHLSAEGN